MHANVAAIKKQKTIKLDYVAPVQYLACCTRAGQ